MSLSKLIKSLKDDTLLVSPKVNQHMATGKDLVYPPWVIDRIAEVVSSTANHERHSRFGSSSRGRCEREQVLSFLSYQQTRSIDIKLQSIFLDGQWRHLKWQAMLLTLGVITDIEYPFAAPFYRLSGSLDGAHVPEEWGVEIKGCNSNVYRDVVKLGPLEHHLLQIGTYMLGTGFRRFSLIYDNKDTSEFKEYVIEWDDVTIDEVEDELGRLNDHIESKTLPEVLDGCKETTRYDCAYRNQCHGAQWQEVALPGSP